MRAYAYTAVDSSGKTRKGVVEGEGPRQVRTLLREQGLLPLEVNEANNISHRPFWVRKSHVGAGEMATAVQQLAILLRAGMPITEALTAVAQHSTSRGLHGVLLTMRSRVMEGHSLAAALDSFPHLFAGMFRETVAAGEHTGRLDLVLEKLADYLENSQLLRRRVLLALTYPAVVLAFSLIVTLALLIFVVPQVMAVFADLHQELPWITLVVMAASTGLRTHWPMLVFGMALLAGGMFPLLSREENRQRLDRLWLRLPVVARLTRGANAARFARIFGTLVASGVPVAESLEIASRVISNRSMRQAVATAHRQVREGAGIAISLGESKLFPPILLHLLACGEASANLPEMLERAATILEREVESLAALLAGLMEPILIILLGVFVLVIVLAILLPIFDLNQFVH